MSVDIQIKCINKTNRDDPHNRIQNVGGTNADGSRWKLSEDQAIQDVNAGKYRFWTAGGGKSVWVIVANLNGNFYLKTEPDGVQPNNLLALPECP